MFLPKFQIISTTAHNNDQPAITMSKLFECNYCGKDDFASSRALTQHLEQNSKCARSAEAETFGHKLNGKGQCTDFGFGDYTEVERHKTRAHWEYLTGLLADMPQKALDKHQIPLGQQEYGDYTTRQQEWTDNWDGNFYPVEQDSEGELSENMDGFLSDGDGSDDDVWRPDASIMANFKGYCERADKKFLEWFTKTQGDAIRLMATLRETKASLDTYESIMKWHMVANGNLLEHQSLGDSEDYCSRKTMFKFLKNRYNIEEKKYGIIKQITLPSTKARARIVMNDAGAAIQSLLSDPRIMPEDYLFWGNDPFSAPPADLDYVADINTGRAYTESYKRLITKPGKQVLLPVIFYIDGAACGQFSPLKITAVKFTLGIFTREARSRPWMWRTIGYVPEVKKGKSQGQHLLRASGHADAQMAHQDAMEGEGNLAGARAVTAQDFHTILAQILESYLPLEEKGFVWDLRYNGTVQKVEFVLYTDHMNVDTDEADRLCGAYTSRVGVSQLCRYCCCPLDQSDDPFCRYAKKNVRMMTSLVNNNDVKGLKAMSQQNIRNATYLLKFGAHNKDGIHGATPMEMLHALLLGIFMYVRDMFFEQTGETSQLSDEINALCIEYGELFSRQSERDMPKTRFSGGIRRGKLMAKEYTGVLLVLAAVLRSSHGRKLLTDETNKSNNGQFTGKGLLQDWIMLIETLLQWETWLKSDRMEKSDVEKAEYKHRYIMFLIKKIGKRAKGMGLKTTKFHAIMHMAEDILNFGVPNNFDTGANESGHKPTKTAAKLTQQQFETFEEQTNTRLTEVHCLDLAAEEMEGRRLWDYDQGFEFKHQNAKKIPPPYLGGAQFNVHYCQESRAYSIKLATRMQGLEKMRVEKAFVDWVGVLQRKVGFPVPIYANHYRDGITFRGSPMHTGKVWRDWVMVDWANDDVLPSKVWGFVDLRALPEDNDVQYGGYDGITPGLHAIVECADYVTTEIEVQRSEIFVPILKEVGEIRQGRVTKLKFYLAEVEAIVAPLAVIPDIGGPPNGYFVVRHRLQWQKDFVAWLREGQEVSEDDITEYDG
jgi:hypothetical protein